MKYLTWFGGLLASLIIGIYILVFTSFGNSIFQPIIESKIKEQTKLESKLSKFSLNMSEFSIVLELDRDNIIYVNGNYSLFSKAFNILYKIEMDKLASLKPLTNAPLKGKFHTDGNVKGDMSYFVVDGKSDVASSATTYHVELTNLNPTSIIANIKELKLAAFLEMLGEKQYASADVNLDVNFKNITPHALDGDIKLATKDGKINTKVMKKDFHIVVPPTNFTMNLDAKLKGDDVNYTYTFLSNLFKVNSSGKVRPTPLYINIKYAFDVKELALLKPITGADVRGAFRLDGKVNGSKSNLIVDGKSDLASSDTNFEAVLKQFILSKVKFSMKNLKLSRVLYMVKQPPYAEGIFSLDVDIKDAKSGKLDGIILTKIKSGRVNSAYMTKAYEFETPMPKTTFTMKTDTKLQGNMINTKIDLDSSLANLKIKKASFNLDAKSLVSDYAMQIPNLDKFFFATNQHMKGSMLINGELKKAKDLDLNIHTKVAGGKIDATLHNDDFHADIKSVQTLDALHMLIYPEIFKSSLDAKLDYNLLSKKGDFKGYLTEGTFTKNQVLTLVKQYAHVDMYAQRFKGDVSAKINKEKILASMHLKSNTSSIKTKDTKLNTLRKTINSKIEIVANSSPITVELNGNISKPKVKIDANKLLEKEAEKAVKKEVGNFLKGLF
ncbi:hypothetical protein [Sulfurimonas sp.]|uniref:hypothetical protein n=1 Tax=Sulfurimonas sp. TaxID=2022749 RepID=UPI002AB2E667|nr:hypothetical protein [Sulfurimonas sp.]